VGEGQEIAKPTYNPAWLNPEDMAIPPDADYKALYTASKAKLDKIAEIIKS